MKRFLVWAVYADSLVHIYGEEIHSGERGFAGIRGT